ncbi:MAG: 3-phosphoshikimate 1-carboxyvinyltransferase [Candidatus Arsenophonus melophagi]|nr:3-phosphoshikimate 1-carboxyvinyltransferase [Candidatus Arsenophonus melophagi]
MSALTIQPISYIEGTIKLPGSKSISNRALLLSALAEGQTILKNLPVNEDIRHMLNALTALGVKYQLSKDFTTCIITGNGHYFIHQHGLEIFLGNAGTAMRPLSAILALADNDIILTGEPRMKERPIGHLIDALQQCGATINYLEKPGYPPIRIKGGFHGGNITVPGCVSSQFLTALLIAAPLARDDTTIQIRGELVSKPYIDITIAMMRSFGVVVDSQSYDQFYIEAGQQYMSPGHYLIEGDASSASYFLAAAAIKGGTVKVKGIDKDSVQGDIQFAEVLKKMGARIGFGDGFIECQRDTLIGIDIDMSAIPDVAMTVATLALFVKNETVIRNIYNWRFKETNRLTAMAKELVKVGATVEEGSDYLRITPHKLLQHAQIETYNDHRMAMCFSLVALSGIPITILDPECAAKTFPDYFNQLEKISYRD